MAKDEAWLADKRRYPKRPFLKEQSIWALAVYRWGRRIDQRRPGPVRWIHDRLYWVSYRIVETLTGIMLPRTAEIGPGLRIHHFYCLVGKNVKMGANCTLRQGVVLGQRTADGPEPIIEDDVEFSAGAMVFGGVRIGKGARIGAMTLVMTDVPPGATAVGNPARIIERKSGAEAKPSRASDRSEASAKATADIALGNGSLRPF